MIEQNFEWKTLEKSGQPDQVCVAWPNRFLKNVIHFSLEYISHSN